MAGYSDMKLTFKLEVCKSLENTFHSLEFLECPVSPAIAEFLLKVIKLNFCLKDPHKFTKNLFSFYLSDGYKLTEILRSTSKLKCTEILFNLFSLGFPQSLQHWRGLAVWFVEK